MRRSLSVRTVATTLLLAASLWLAAFSVTHAEAITNFDVTIVVEENSNLTITERITYDFGALQRRGIFREVLGDHAQSASTWYKHRYVELTPISVTRNGEPEGYVEEGTGDDLFLRIGDANRTITGEHTYQITYRARGALSVYPDTELTEVYWNVTGGNWEVPIEYVEVEIRPANDVLLGSQAACYTGLPGSNSSCAKIMTHSSATVFVEENIRPGNQLTIAQAVELPQPAVVLERINWLPFVSGGILLIFVMSLFVSPIRKLFTRLIVGVNVLVTILLLFAIIPLFISIDGFNVFSESKELYVVIPLGILLINGVLAYRWHTRFKLKQPIVAQYEPYEQVEPMFAGILVDRKLDSRDITAGILHLAQKGFLAIKQKNEKILGLFTTSDYEVTLLLPIGQASTRFERDLLELLFEGQPGAEFTKGFGLFKSLTSEYRTSSSSMAVGKTIRLSDIKNNQSKLRVNFKILQALRRDARADLISGGYIEIYDISRKLESVMTKRNVIIAITVAFVIVVINDLLLMLLGLSALLLILPYLAYYRTEKGYAARNHLLGFKDFLSTTEKDRYAFHNAPDKNPEQFMEYLPYAIAFGVEQEWAEVFKDIDIPAPEWYSSSVAGAHFNATDFTSDMSAFSGSLASSGSSGSSGGGSAGGGSGGGGGGSW